MCCSNIGTSDGIIYRFYLSLIVNNCKRKLNRKLTTLTDWLVWWECLWLDLKKLARIFFEKGGREIINKRDSHARGCFLLETTTRCSGWSRSDCGSGLVIFACKQWWWWCEGVLSYQWNRWHASVDFYFVFFFV